MKKYLLGLILALALLVSPAAADDPLKLVVDGKVIDKPIVIVDNSAYVPIRAVADAFKAETEWDDITKTITIISNDDKQLERPKIKGDTEFKDKINDALDLLEQKDFPHYVLVCKYTKRIEQLTSQPGPGDERTLADSLRGKTHIYLMLTNDPQRYTPISLAGVLVHEGCHATNYGHFVERTEKQAYANEVGAYMALDAPQWLITECINSIK